MVLKLLPAIVALSICGLRFVDSIPRWTSTAYNQRSVYALKGESYNFVWLFTEDNQPIEYSNWYLKKPNTADPPVPKYVTIPIASRSGTGSATILVVAKYQGRAIFQSGNNAGFELKNVEIADQGEYACRLSFRNVHILSDGALLVVVVPPVINIQTSSPVNVDISEGEHYTLLCDATGNPTPRIRWLKDNLVVQDRVDYSGYNITYAGRKDIGLYRCDAIVTGGSIMKKDNYEIRVNVRYKPEVTYLSPNKSLTENNNVILECTAVGEPQVTQYHWYKGKGKINRLQTAGKYSVTGDRGRQLQINNLKKEDSDWYTCAAKNDVGVGNGTSTYVNTLYAPKIVTISFSPSNKVNITGSVKLTCVSDGMPLPTFKWKSENKPISGSGERNKEIRMTQLTIEQAGNFTCEATNTHGSRWSETEDFYVNYKPFEAKFTTGIANYGAILNSRTLLTCIGNGYPPPHFIIKKKDGTQLSKGAKNFVALDPVLLTDQQKEFSCIPYNDMGVGPEIEASVNVLVTPYFVALTNLPTIKVTRTENDTQNYTCAADAKPAADIIWVINGENVTDSTPYLGSVEALASTSPTNLQYYRTVSTLDLSPMNWKQAGNISCIARNDAGDKQQTVKMIVRHRPVVMNPDKEVNNITLDTAQDAVFICRAVGNPAATSYVWRFKGEIIRNENEQKYIKKSVNQDDAGKYWCSGVNILGEGPAYAITLLIKTPARITYFPKAVANVTGAATLICRTTGVPPPTVTWTRFESNVILHRGEDFEMRNLTYEDRGFYTCIATNELYRDKAKVELVVQVKPNITSNKPTDTQIAGIIGEQSSIRCVVRAIPYADIVWTRGDDPKSLDARSDRVVSINEGDSQKTLVIRVKEFGELYYCYAKNLLGSAKQKFTIRKIGPPDAPVNLLALALIISGKRVINVNLTWIAGYGGGGDKPQTFTVRYRLKASEIYTDVVIGADTHYIINELKPSTEYIFQVRATNEKGEIGPFSDRLYYVTPASAVPPARGTMLVKRIGDGTRFQISWTMHKNVTHTYLQYREVSTRARREDVRWNDVVGAQGLSGKVKTFLVVNLDGDKAYQFRILFKVPGEKGFTNAMAVDSDIIEPLSKTAESKGLKEDELIAIIAASGGVLLILIVVLCLCCFKGRKKPFGGESVQMSQTGSHPNLFSSYGDVPDAVRMSETRSRSYAAESVEDDPFIDAHIANEMRKKRKPSENGINHGYASQGSRAGIRGMSQSVGQLDARSSYSSSGPQRDFSTLPPYHEPPTFEEAVRQSVRKSKQALSTGDLTAPPRPPGGRSRSKTPDSDSSDAEPLNRRPMFKVKPIGQGVDHRYTSAPVLPSPGGSPVKHGSRKPTPYSRPQKKGPPPQYTAEDRVVIPGMEDGYEPRFGKRRPKSGDVLELDDRPNYRRNDRLPDLPPRMAEMPNGRGTMHKEPMGETLPEPPSFLRDLSYDDDDEYDTAPRYPRSHTEPRNRGRQPYVNIHGQLVRPGSPGREPAYGADRREPIYANDPPRLVAPEPEVPAGQRSNQTPSVGSEEHQPGYVSSGFLV